MKTRQIVLVLNAVVAIVLLSSCSTGGEQKLEQTAGQDNCQDPDYLAIVKSYVETLVQKCRDTHGSVHSPLIATTVDRGTLRMYGRQDIEWLRQIRLQDWENWRIRNADRAIECANPQHDQNLYQVLYALTEITGDKRYADQADNTLKWFFENCQSPTTGLLAWGEHMGWNLNSENIVQNDPLKHKLVHEGLARAYEIHEFAQPWVLWDRSFELAPEPCLRFAGGLWDHQMADDKTGNFSRHANYSRHQTFTDAEFPRHGGFYIATWAHAYSRTKDGVYVKAIETLVDYFNGRRSTVSDGLPAESSARFDGKSLWATSNLSLAIDLAQSADKMPGKLARKIRKSASRTDKIFLKLAHDLGKDGKGFLITAHVDTLEPLGASPYTGPWSHAGTANLCLIRYRQTKLAGYRELVLDAASLYLDSEPQIKYALHPGQLGSVIYLMLGAYELTDDKRYLNRADHYARRSIELFLDDGCPLPKVNTKYDHYEAVTGADTLMMAMLKLWAVTNRPGKELSLVYNDR